MVSTCALALAEDSILHGTPKLEAVIWGKSWRCHLLHRAELMFPGRGASLSSRRGTQGAAGMRPQATLRSNAENVRNRATSRAGGAPNRRLYSRLNCDGLS